MKNDTILAFRTCTLIAVAVVTAGCSSFNPYQRSERLDLPLATLRADAKIPADQNLAGQLDGALAAVKHQRQEWYDSLSAQARVRAASQLTIIGVTATALYHGLKSGVTGSGDKRGLALAGALGATTFAAGDWYVNVPHEAAYIDGISGLTCKMLLIEPFRMKEESFSRMGEEQKTLTLALNKLDKALLKANALYRYDSKDDAPQAKVRVEARQALARARTTLASSEQLHRAADNSGITLLRDADLVVAAVADQIRSGHKNVTPPGTTLQSLSGIIGKYKAVKVDPEELKDANEKTKDEPNVPAKTDAPADVNGAKTTPAADAASAPKVTKVSDASPQVLIDELLTRFQKQYDNAMAAADTKMSGQLRKAIKASEQAEKSAIQAGAAAQRSLDYCKQAGRDDCKVAADTEATQLAEKTAALYAARRPLSHRLLTFSEAAKAAQANRACVGAGSTMTVAPNTDANVQAGAVYTLAVNGASARPNVSIKGNASHKTYLGQGHQYMVEVSVSEGASGFIDIAISDASFTEEIRLTVVAKTL